MTDGEQTRFNRGWSSHTTFFCVPFQEKTQFLKRYQPEKIVVHLWNCKLILVWHFWRCFYLMFSFFLFWVFLFVCIFFYLSLCPLLCLCFLFFIFLPFFFSLLFSLNSTIPAFYSLHSLVFLALFVYLTLSLCFISLSLSLSPPLPLSLLISWNIYCSV